MSRLDVNSSTFSGHGACYDASAGQTFYLLTHPTRMLVAVCLSLAGAVIVLPMSIGNNPNDRRPRQLLVASIVCVAFTL